MANYIDTRGGGQNLLSDMMDRRPGPRPISGGGFARPMPPQGGSGGGGISPRLDELGNNVSSAEEELNSINQRLDSADSKLGGGENGGLGKLLTNFGNLGESNSGLFNKMPENNPARMPAADGGLMELMELMGGTELMAGAPDITYSGDEGPKAPKEMEEIQMAQIKKIYFELIADGMNPKDAEIKAKEIYSKMSSNVTSSGNESGTLDEGIGSMMQEPRTMAAEGGMMVQGGVKNYLGKQKTISNVPVKWKSAPNHPQTELAYITKAEKDLLLKKDLHDSLDGGPNRGPGGLMSLNGWGDASDGFGSDGVDSGNSNDQDNSGYSGNDNSSYQNPKLPPKVQDAVDKGEKTSVVTKADEKEAAKKQKEKEKKAEKKRKEDAKAKKAKKDQEAQEKLNLKIASNKDLRLFDKNKDGILGFFERHAKRRNDNRKIRASKNSIENLEQIKQYLNTYDDYSLDGVAAAKARGYKVDEKIDTNFYDINDVENYDRDPTAFTTLNFTGYDSNPLTNPDAINPSLGYDFRPKSMPGGEGMKTMTSNKGTSLEKTRQNLYGVNSRIPFSPLGNSVANKIRPDTSVTAQNTLDNAALYNMVAGKDLTTTEDLREIRNRGRTEEQIRFLENPTGTGGYEAPNSYVPPIIPETKEEEEEEPFQLGLAFRADGGRVGKAYGGSMGDDGRRAYGLGSIFKKIKKVFKSPLGKAVLLGLGGYGLAGGLGGSSFMTGLKSQGLSGLLKKAGSYALKNPGVVIPAASAAAALFTDEEDEDEYVDNTGIDVKKIRANPYEYLARANRAEGGPMGGEIMEGESEELLDMNGMEKDYREDGGFVPIGEYEKKDDVPARLSKNEFVFTADAVRGAGEGDVDLGAEKLYTQMKELESVGKRMQGANEMFETSQRLEEII